MRRTSPFAGRLAPIAMLLACSPALADGASTSYDFGSGYGYGSGSRYGYGSGSGLSYGGSGDASYDDGSSLSGAFECLGAILQLNGKCDVPNDEPTTKRDLVKACESWRECADERTRAAAACASLDENPLDELERTFRDACATIPPSPPPPASPPSPPPASPPPAGLSTAAVAVVSTASVLGAIVLACVAAVACRANGADAANDSAASRA